MLEQRIENLEEQVSKLTIAIEKLTEVLLSPTPVSAAVKSIKAKKKEEPTQEKAVDVEDVRAALINLSKAKGKNAAKNLLADFDAAKVGDLKKSDYVKLVDVANQYREAA